MQPVSKTPPMLLQGQWNAIASADATVAKYMIKVFDTQKLSDHFP